MTKIITLLVASSLAMFTSRAALSDEVANAKTCVSQAAKPVEVISSCSVVVLSKVLNGHNLAIVFAERAMAYEQLGQHARAIDDYNQEIKLDPGNANAWYNRAISRSNAKDDAGAIGDYSKAIQIKPDFVDAILNLGLLFERVHRPQEAVADLSRVIYLKPKLSAGYAIRGWAYEALNDYGRALKDLNTAVDLNPHDEAAYATRGGLLQRHSEYALSIADFDMAIKQKPDFGFAYALRGSSYRHLGDLDKAFRDYDKATEVNPHNGAVFGARCWARAALKQKFDLALTDCAVAIRDQPGNSGPYGEAGFLYLQFGQYEKAIDNYNRALFLDSKNADALFGRGIVEHRLGKQMAAEADIAAARKIDPRVDHDYSEDGVKP